MTLIITKQESPATKYECINGARVAVAHVVKGTAFRISLRVDHTSYDFHEGRLHYELFYATKKGATILAPVPGEASFRMTVASTNGKSCDINCRILTLSSRHGHRCFAFRIRLVHPTRDEEFVETFTGVMYTWARLSQISCRASRARRSDEEWTDVKSKKRVRDDTLIEPLLPPPPVTLETTFAAFLNTWSNVPFDERPTKLRRLVADLPGEQQSLANDVGYFLSQRESDPEQWMPSDFDNPTLSSPGETCEFIDVDSFFV
jgi:hypothetical protein